MIRRGVWGITYSFETFGRMGGKWRKMYGLGCVILMQEG
jgi:hypothetical protein